MEGIKAELIEKLESGAIKPYELEELVWERLGRSPDSWEKANREAAELRRLFLEKGLGKRLENIARSYVSVSRVRGESRTTGIEQQIGGAIVPLGFAGPVRITSKHAKGEFYLPLATNEAALVAGLSRGCKAVNLSGGVRAHVVRDLMTRAPVVEAASIERAAEIAKEIGSRSGLYSRMKEAAERESSVSRLMDIQPFQLGRRLHLRFCFQTGDSMGMNSATRYAGNAIRVLLDAHRDLNLLSLTGNMCTDKKSSHINVLLGRGKSVEAESVLPRKVIEGVFNVKPEMIVKLNIIKNHEGSMLSGTFAGFNANAANTIAAMFIATGQDCAQIVESASCFTRAEMNGDSLVFGVTLPCLEIATVGGGTEFGTARECLDILGCAGAGGSPGSNARKLAEIIAAAVTAQELNLIATEASQYELAESHIRLARGK